MATVYAPDHEEINQLKAEITKLEYQQQQLSLRMQENRENYNVINTQLAECYKKLNELNEIKNVYDEYPTKEKEVTKRIIKKALKFGILSTIALWFVGGAIFNSFVGAIVGAALANAIVVISSIVSHNNKLKKDKEIIKNNNIRRVKRKIEQEETKIDNYLSQQRQIDQDNKVTSRVYGENQKQLEDLKLKLSILEPTTSPTYEKPYTKTKTTQS